MLLRRAISDVVFSCEEVGAAIIAASDHQQREVLVAMVNRVDLMDMRGGSWACQCRAIVNGVNGADSGLSASDRSRIASMLNCLLDHLNEPVVHHGLGE